MNRLDLSWFLQACSHAKGTARLALAQYEGGRISLQAMTDAIRDRFLISCDLNPIFLHADLGLDPIRVDKDTNCYPVMGAAACTPNI